MQWKKLIQVILWKFLTLEMVRHCIIAFINQKLRISLYQFLIFSSFFPRSSHSQRTVKSTNSSGSSRIPIKRNSSLRKKKNVMNQYKSGTDEEEPQTLVIEPQIPPASPSKMPIRYAIFRKNTYNISFDFNY